MDPPGDPSTRTHSGSSWKHEANVASRALALQQPMTTLPACLHNVQLRAGEKGSDRRPTSYLGRPWISRKDAHGLLVHAVRTNLTE